MRSVLPDLAELAAVAAYAPHLAQAFASLACDLALVLGRDGVITQLALSAGSPLALSTAGWLGLPLADTVTPATRHKIDRQEQLVVPDVRPVALIILNLAPIDECCT